MSEESRIVESVYRILSPEYAEWDPSREGIGILVAELDPMRNRIAVLIVTVVPGATLVGRSRRLDSEGQARWDASRDGVSAALAGAGFRSITPTIRGVEATAPRTDSEDGDPEEMWEQVDRLYHGATSLVLFSEEGASRTWGCIETDGDRFATMAPAGQRNLTEKIVAAAHRHAERLHGPRSAWPNFVVIDRPARSLIWLPFTCDCGRGPLRSAMLLDARAWACDVCGSTVRHLALKDQTGDVLKDRGGVLYRGIPEAAPFIRIAGSDAATLRFGDLRLELLRGPWALDEVDHALCCAARNGRYRLHSDRQQDRVFVMRPSLMW